MSVFMGEWGLGKRATAAKMHCLYAIHTQRAVESWEK